MIESAQALRPKDALRVAAFSIIATIVVGGCAPDRAATKGNRSTGSSPPVPTWEAGQGPEFNRAAALHALNAAAAAAKPCARADGPTGLVRAQVTFAPDGSVTAVSLDPPSFDRSLVGACIAAELQRARVPAWDSAPVTVSKSITVAPPWGRSRFATGRSSAPSGDKRACSRRTR